MLSLHQAIEIKESIVAYLKATFTFQDKNLQKAFDDFINHPREGMFKGPYLSLKLRFVKANQEEIDQVPLDIKPDWKPYDHQVKSWQRLSTREGKPEPTIVTTGTGSGKTESFLYPALDYCYKNIDRPGIKIIILYPMNALATDQAKRLAEAIHEDDRLRGKITAGLFIGEGENAAKYPKNMGPDNIIENRNSIVDSPPDILLTNFKMLDYGLMKSRFHKLWIHNLKDTELLQFLILDELHTYDGAQGTDVANLIRRLKLKLNLEKGQLCPVGTSATIGSGAEAPQLLADYASKIFGEAVTTDAIITENRITPEEFFGEDESLDGFLPRAQKLKDTALLKEESFEDFIKRQVAIWQLDVDDLSSGLRHQKIVKDLVKVCNEGNGIHLIEVIEKELARVNLAFRDIPQWDETHQFNPRRALIESLFALLSQAKDNDIRRSPFLYAQSQLWIRELSGIQRVFGNEPKFIWKDHVELNRSLRALPPWFCRECGASGWLGVIHDNKMNTRIERDIRDVYELFFSNHKNAYFISPSDSLSLNDFEDSGYEPSDVLQRFVSQGSLDFVDEEEENTVDVLACRKLNSHNKADHVCPSCNTRNNMAIIGTRIATLSSVSISQTLATDLDPQNDQKRKVLAFTNSVQDAAHQAGFVEARNYRFTLRSSLQKVINESEGSVPLDELATSFIEYWKKHADESGRQPLDAYFYRFYPKDYLGKSSPEDYKEDGRYYDNFKREFDQRVTWEIYAEFGYDSLIGRTLEKTGTSAVSFRKEPISAAIEKMMPWVEVNTPTIKKEQLEQFIFLFLHRIRSRGAIAHPFLEKFRRIRFGFWDLNWMRDGSHFLNKTFGPRTRIPRLLSTQPLPGNSPVDTTHARTTNWFRAFYKKSFQLASNYIDVVNEFYEHLVDALFEAEIFDRITTGEGIHTHALNPKNIIVTDEVYSLSCTKCSHIIYTADKSADGVDGKCLNFRCTGTYHYTPEQTAPNYYQAVYNRNRSPRIYAAEHTGLLERLDREKLEVDFKTRPDFNSKNALVATSTLEMGIDIGSLNTAYNNSVPPLPSNFLQRIGRAGRASGSALIINFSQNKQHDLYYYQEPMDMMAGEVSTPGCYLEAKEILRRHFFAYCIDTWTTRDSINNKIPDSIKSLKIEIADLNSPSFFLNRILNFVKKEETTLFKNFQVHYVGEVKEEVFNELNSLLEKEQFYLFYTTLFKNLQKEIRDLKNKQKEIKSKITALKLAKEDPERIELEQWFRNLGGIINSIRQRKILEHLTNYGALPNYAFPETGVTLAAKVRGRQVEGSKNPPLEKAFEIVRSAGMAIKEFVPDSHFYSQGFKFLVSGINTFDWADTENYHQKRFCSNCDHIENEDTIESRGNCPKCGDESWSSSTNVHQFAKLVTVKSFNDQSRATLNDSKDDRENLICHRQKHFHFDQTTSRGAWALREIPFGIEFVKSVRMTETNMGRIDSANSRKIRINNTELPAPGYITCRYCGKSTSNIHQRDYRYHFPYCKHKEEDYKGEPDSIFEEVFFFREMQTEALKIILPVQELNSEAEVKMFKAGIELGLKKYYKGNPQHIQLAEYKEFNNKTLRFDRYVVLYDQVPGGTGYLEQLFDREEFSSLLTESYQAISTCSCQHDGKDGCYHCIFSYSNQYYQSELSREKAESRFKRIIEKTEGWEKQTGGLADVANTGQIEESELEDRFVRSLKKFADTEEAWIFRSVNEDGIINYTLEYQSGDRNLAYHIRPQVDLGPVDGITYHTRADFLMICTRAEIRGIDKKNEVPRIAIYLDGYQYHASDEHNRFENDFKKRKAIIANPEYLTWTLTWKDIDQFDQIFLEEKDRVDIEDELRVLIKRADFAKTRKTLIASTKKEKIDFSIPQNNFERFVLVLKNPLNDEVFKTSLSLYWAFFQEVLLVPSFAPDAKEAAFSQQGNSNKYCVENKTLNGWLQSKFLSSNDLFDLRTISNIEMSQVESRLMFLKTEVIDKGDWQIFWSYFNMLQFSPLTDVLEFKNEVAQIISADSDYLATAMEAIEFFDTEYQPIVTQLIQSGYVKSEADEIRLNSLLDEKDQPIAEAELIITHKKMVFEPCSEKDKSTFEKHGFSVLDKDQLNKQLI